MMLVRVIHTFLDALWVFFFFYFLICFFFNVFVRLFVFYPRVYQMLYVLYMVWDRGQVSFIENGQNPVHWFKHQASGYHWGGLKGEWWGGEAKRALCCWACSISYPGGDHMSVITWGNSLSHVMICSLFCICVIFNKKWKKVYLPFP